MSTSPPGRKSFFHHAATASVLALPLAIAAVFIAIVPAALVGPEGKKVVLDVLGIFAGVVVGFGILAGIVALFGIPRYGAKGIRGKALWGILLPLAFFALGMATDMMQRRNYDAALEEIADGLNRRCPLVRDGVRLESVKTGPNHTLIYECTILYATRDELAPGSIDALIRPNMLAVYQANSIMRKLGVNVISRCKDRAGELITEVKVGPGDVD